MLKQHFFNDHYSHLTAYLNRNQNTIIFLIDSEYIIRDCNSSFTIVSGFEHEPVGIDIRTLLAAEDEHLISNIKDADKLKPVSFTMQGSRSERYGMKGFAVKTEKGYLFICEKISITDDKVVEEISILNNELANITRELNKKNIALQRANDRINELLKTDSLTGIANRRYFLDYFIKMHANAIRNKVPLSLVMADLDFFKAINDRYGHQAGDDVLKEFARILENNCRKEDLPARYGGEEFAILLVHTGANQALIQAERIRSCLEETSIGAENIQATARFGIAELKNEQSIDILIKQADDALYRAKHEGRNRVLISSAE